MQLSPDDVYTDFMKSIVDGGVQNPYALAAIAATGMAESGFSPQNANRTWNDPSESGQAGTAGGLMSWRNERLANLHAFAASNGEAQGAISPSTQAKFFLQENPDLTQALNGAKSVQQAQSLMNKAWAYRGYQNAGGETAHRMSLANSFLPQFSGDNELSSATTGYVDPRVSAPNSSARAFNAMAAATLAGVPANPVHLASYVPPPFSGQQGNFTPLVDSGDEGHDQPPTTVQRQDMPPPADHQGDALLKAWGLQNDNQPAAAPEQQPAPAGAPAAAGSNDNADVIKAWGLDSAAPVASVTPGNTDTSMARLIKGEPQSQSIGLNDAVRSVGTGVPIVGGLLNKMNAGTNALLAPVLNPLFSENEQLKGNTIAERYANSLDIQEGKDKSYAEQHPIANTVGNVVGGVAGTIPMIVAAPGLMGAGSGGVAGNMLAGGISGAAIGGADSAIRSDGDLDATKKGAVIGGLLGGAGPAVGKALGYAGNKLLNALSGTSPAARNVANVLAEIGMTPQQAKNALAKMGPEATLADLDPALTTEAGALAAQGGAPTSILKGAMANRAAGADDRVAQAVETTLGPRPDLTQAQDTIAAKASADASPHYQTAGTDPLDASSVVRSINDKLVNANGSEKTILSKIKGYFTDPAAGDMSAQAQKAAGEGLNPITDYMAKSGSTDSGLDTARQILVGAQNGSIDQASAREALSHLQSADPQAQKLIGSAVDALDGVTSLKTDPAALLKVRQAIDDDLQNAPKSDTTGGKNAIRAAADVRDQIDKVLKANPGIKAGDEAYSAHMNNLRAVEEGQEIFSPKTRIEDMQRSIAGKTPEQVGNMQTGALSSLWDALDNARNGDLTAIKGLLGKSTANRQKLEALFPNSSEIFDKISNEAAMRATEQRVAQNSATAERLAVGQKYAPKSDGVAGTTEAVVGNALAGGPGAVAGYLGRNAINSLKNQITEGSRNALTEGTARGISSTGAEQQAFLNQLQRASATSKVSAAITKGADIGTNLLFRAVSDEARRRQLAERNSSR